MSGEGGVGDDGGRGGWLGGEELFERGREFYFIEGGFLFFMSSEADRARE